MNFLKKNLIVFSLAIVLLSTFSITPNHVQADACTDQAHATWDNPPDPSVADFYAQRLADDLAACAANSGSGGGIPTPPGVTAPPSVNYNTCAAGGQKDIVDFCASIYSDTNITAPKCKDGSDPINPFTPNRTCNGVVSGSANQKCLAQAGSDPQKVRACNCNPSTAPAGPPLRECANNTNTNDNGNNTNNNNGGVPASVECNPKSISTDSTYGLSTTVFTGGTLSNGIGGIQSPRGNVTDSFGDTGFNGDLTLPYNRSQQNNMIGLPVIDVGPLMVVTAYRQIPLLKSICTAVSSLSEDIKAIRKSVDSIDNTTKAIKVDTGNLVNKEFDLDPAVRAAAAAAIQKEKGIFDDVLAQGRPDGKRVNNRDVPNTFTPDINIYEAQQRQKAGQLFLGEIENYFANNNAPYKDAVISAIRQKMNDEYLDNEQKIEQTFSHLTLGQVDTTMDAVNYATSLYDATVSKAGDNAVSEYVAGGTVIGGKTCPDDDWVTVDKQTGTPLLNPVAQTITICRNNNNLTITPGASAPVVKSLIEKFATTKVTQAELADEVGEYGQYTSPISKKEIVSQQAFKSNTDVGGVVDSIKGVQNKNSSISGQTLGGGTSNTVGGGTSGQETGVNSGGTPNNTPSTGGGASGNTGSLAADTATCIENGKKANFNLLFMPEAQAKIALAQITSNCQQNPSFYGTNGITDGSSNQAKGSTPTNNSVNSGLSASVILAKPSATKLSSVKPVSPISLTSTSLAQSTILNLVSNTVTNPISCMATSDWPTFSGSTLSYLFKIGDDIPIPKNSTPQKFTVNHPQLFKLEAAITKPEITSIFDKAPLPQTNIKNNLSATGYGLTQITSYSLDLTNVNVGDTLTFKINNASLSLPITNINPIDLVRRIITEATGGSAATVAAFSNYAFSQNGNILTVSNKIPIEMPIPSTMTYSLDCNVNNKDVSQSVNITFP